LEFSDGKRIESERQNEGMGEAIDYLIREYDLDEEIPIPYRSGYKNALINTTQTHPDGSDMKRPYQLETGYYMSTSLGRERKADNIEELASKVGLIVDFLEGWRVDDD
jgi:hypothetical protein